MWRNISQSDGSPSLGLLADDRQTPTVTIFTLLLYLIAIGDP